ncbi:MarC family protein [Thalassospira tepidiphila]|jgi:multiple antibiotic resistance protein|uniref:MarC family protein n=1 Tax=Thalassospira tepidiphila TaxID=393657 RepID=UPI001BCC30AB|nr:MarC family protein [Thalassospira tepidiphila]MBS8273194.1 MarC family protein [Thalassospira tepidiphila]
MPSLDMLNELIPVFVTLFVIIDPLGLVPVFIVLTQGTSAAHRRRMAIRACLTSFFILAAFALIGEGLLGVFGIHMPAFRIAGGTLLFLIALEMLFEKRSQKRNERAEQVHQELEEDHETEKPKTKTKVSATTSNGDVTIPDDEADDISIFPMSIPFLSGPGAIASVMLLMGKFEDNIAMQASVIGVVAVVMVIAFIFFLLANVVAKRLSPTVATVVSRLLGMILAALAVQFIIDGIKQAFF